jgi:hypothetical protein
LPMRYATLNGVQPDMTDESLRPGSLSCSRRRRGMPGCSLKRMGSPRPWDPELVHIEESDANFTIEWKGHYRIEGDAFIYVDRKTGGTRGPEPSSDTPRRSWRKPRASTEISNIFG